MKKNYNKSVMFYDEAITIEEGLEPRLLVKSIVCLVESNDLDLAKLKIKRCLKLDPTSCEALYLKG